MQQDETHTRFLAKIKKSRKGCWEWQGGITHGYGQFWFRTKDGSKGYRAHRYAYEYYKGEIKKDLTIDHLCRNRKCVNPDHLEMVTNKENILRGKGLTAMNARKKLCIRGHKLSGQNVLTLPRKGTNVIARGCRKCRCILRKKWKHSAKGKEWRQKNIDHVRELQKMSTRRWRLKKANALDDIITNLKNI